MHLTDKLDALTDWSDAFDSPWAMHGIAPTRRGASRSAPTSGALYTAVATGIPVQLAVGAVSTGLANTVALVVSQVVH